MLARALSKRKKPLLTMFHHDSEEFHHHLRAGSDKNLPLPSFFCIVDAAQSICQSVHANHLDGCAS